MRALEGRSAELARKVGQLEALGKVGEAVSSSLDLDTVLSTIVMHAVQLSGTDGGSLMEFDEAQQSFFVRTAYGTSDEVLEQLRNVTISLHGTFVGRARDGGAADSDRRHAWLELGCSSAGAPRRGLAVMLAHTDAPRGTDRGCVRRAAKAAGDFPEETEELLQTFASQSARWRSSTLGCFESLNASPASWRWSAATSRSSSPACRTSCGPSQRRDRVFGSAARPHVR